MNIASQSQLPRFKSFRKIEFYKDTVWTNGGREKCLVEKLSLDNTGFPAEYIFFTPHSVLS